MSEIDSQASQGMDRAYPNPVLTIVIQSWTVPVISVLMLVIGLFGGYFARSLFRSQSPEIIASPSTETISSSDDSANPKIHISNPEGLAEFVVSSTRHFKGDPDAPVTMIEFSDFQ